MEWLQDALEDAQYLVALTSGRMEPIRSWPEIPQVEVEKYIAEIKSIDPDALSLDTICQQQLGFYLVCILCTFKSNS
jgi:NAD-dependent SIR2 family protein deacetylase